MTPTGPQAETQLSVASRARWIALAVVCAESLMNVLDTTIVGVALLAARVLRPAATIPAGPAAVTAPGEPALTCTEA
jgi:hypothetical protein